MPSRANQSRALASASMARQRAIIPRLVAQQPEQREVGVHLAIEHRLQVELDVGLAGQANVVAQDAQLQAVADETP